MALLSIVLPSYNEAQNIAHTTQVLSELLQQEQIDYELIFVSDGSKDGTYQEILKAAEQNPRVRGAQFSRNFGKEAVECGLRGGGGNQDQPGPGEFSAQVLCRGLLQNYERSDQDGHERLLGL